MDSEGLHLNIDYVGSSGIILSPEQKAALQTSLVILKNSGKFNRVYFWGKILGVKDDYFIAQGVGRDEIEERKTFYSKDCVHWGLLPPATKAMKEQSKLAKGRFTGDPSYEFEHIELKKAEEGEENVEEETKTKMRFSTSTGELTERVDNTITIKEEDRLSSVIAEIDEDVKIVPRAAFIKTPEGKVIANRSFEGLSVSEAAKLCSYMHFREPINLQEKSLLQKANLDKAIDFLDTLEEDIPKGSWSLQFERGSGLVTLRSLLWLGYVSYHVPGTRFYGSCYVGNGEKNLDLPFML
ncbi:radial spoke head protein 9 homolog isoform X1 [Ostrea edulis]|uniref:radial spoke head protein 9 homolog isoform X1 n=1 Tax=Ostrea edulis TaxID=37623 RepID=UPI00209552A2|nr:radial spoke head protein 9 homolog isoform X1 [Ostrea edulis]